MICLGCEDTKNKLSDEIDHTLNLQEKIKLLNKQLKTKDEEITKLRNSLFYGKMISRKIYASGKSPDTPRVILP